MDEVDNGQNNKEKEVDFATGSSMLIRCDVLRQIGLLDDKYFCIMKKTIYARG